MKNGGGAVGGAVGDDDDLVDEVGVEGEEMVELGGQHAAPLWTAMTMLMGAVPVEGQGARRQGRG